MEQQPCKVLLMELSKQSDTIPLTVFQPAFLVIEKKLFEMTKKKLSQLSQNAFFSQKIS